MTQVSAMQIAWVISLLFCTVNESASGEDATGLRPNGYKKWRKNPKMVVFGDSTGDSGRRFNAPPSFDFEGIGAFPWRKLYSANDTEEKFRAYLPSPGAVTNGKAWPDWLRVPEELNFATSSASMTATYRSGSTCLGYTGEGEDFPTGTLNEQIDRYFNDIVYSTNETLGYTHIITLGANDMANFLEAVYRYQVGQVLQTQGAFGGNAYEDPVAFDKVFEIVNGTSEINAEPLITEVVTELSTGIQRLLAIGVTGRILVGNVPSFKGMQDLVLSGVADTIDQLALATNAAVEQLVNTNPQLRLLDLYTLFAAIADNTQIFESLGFSGPENATEDLPVPLGTPCLQIQFAVDYISEIMGTQDLRAASCQEECALCADSVSPCQNCYAGNPSATVCDDPDSRIFWDSRHPSTAAHLLLGEAARLCSKDKPNYNRPFVQILCPDVE